jgi:hypothetical protein
MKEVLAAALLCLFSIVAGQQKSPICDSTNVTGSCTHCEYFLASNKRVQKNGTSFDWSLVVRVFALGDQADFSQVYLFGHHVNSAF